LALAASPVLILISTGTPEMGSLMMGVGACAGPVAGGALV
jgi:hypothetical protein